jgi:RHS repeat-associated protein
VCPRKSDASHTAYTYDDAGRETIRSATAAGPTSRASLTRTFNRAGQVLTENSQITGDPTNGTTTYTYDPLERLTSAARSGMSTLTYTWDEVPNRLSVQTGAGTPVATTYDAANRPLNQNGVSNVFSSDADGRLTTQPTAAGAAFQRYEWDSLGRLTKVRGATGTGAIATYTYDPLDRLRMVDYGANNRVRFRYVGLTTSVAQTIDDASGLVLRNVGTNWNGERLLDWTGTNANIRYYGTNAHHDTVWTASSTGTVSATLRYDPFGTLTNSTGSLPDFRFQGSWYDATTSIQWVVTRWYAPALGRFLSEDSLLGEPNDPPSRHLYAYAAGEPIARWDPDGRFWYRVRSGDTLWALATRYLGSGTRWREIANINPATIPHPPTIRTGSCIRIPLTRTNQCLASGASVLGTPNYTLYDKVLASIVHEINYNCCTTRDVGYYDDPWLYTQYPADTVAWINLVTILDFFYATAPRGAWDHKPPLRAIAGTGSRGFYVPIRGDPVPEIVKYDIWSNIHFGYVGSAHNIPKDLILHACTLAGGVSFSDILSCKIGMNLFSKHKDHSWQITKSELQAAVLKALPTYRDYVIHYGETTVRPGYKNWLQ